MMTFVDLDFDLENLALCVVFHSGDDGPGSDRMHYVWAVEAYDMPPYVDAWRWAAPRIVDDVIVRTALDNAMLLARHLVANPAIVQDCCAACRFFSGRPNVPRLNIYKGGVPKIITPCVLEYWL